MAMARTDSGYLLSLLRPGVKTAQQIGRSMGIRPIMLNNGVKPTVLNSGVKPTVLGSRAPNVLGSRAPTTLGSRMPTVLGSRMPTTLGSRMPTTLGSRAPNVPGSRAPTVLGGIKPTTLGSRAPTVLGSAKPTVLGSRPPTVLGGSKTAQCDGQDTTKAAQVDPDRLSSIALRQPGMRVTVERTPDGKTHTRGYGVVSRDRNPEFFRKIDELRRKKLEQQIAQRRADAEAAKAVAPSGPAKPVPVAPAATRKPVSSAWVPASAGMAAPVATAYPRGGVIGPSVAAQTLAEQQARAAKVQQIAESRGSGNPDYDRLPDVVADKRDAERAKIWDEYTRSQGVVPVKSFKEVQDDHRDFKSWGDRLMPERGYREAGKTTGEIIRNSLRDFGEDWAHDTLNNWQLFANNVQRGAGDLARFVGKWGDWNSWGSSTAARLNRQQHDNAWANARNASQMRDLKILDSMSTGLGSREIEGKRGVNDFDKWLSRVNYATRAGGGQFVGGDAVAMGAGTLAKGVSTAIRTPVHALARQAGNLTSRGVTAAGNTRPVQAVSSAISSAKASRPVQAVSEAVSPVTDKVRYFRSGFGQTARNLEQSRLSHIVELQNRGIDPSRFAELASPKAYRAWWAHGMGGRTAIPRARFESIAGIAPKRSLAWRMGTGVERGIAGVGDTIAQPFTTIGRLGDPVGTVANTATAKAVAQPVTDLASLIRHPRIGSRAIAEYVRQHPWQATGRALSYPVRYPYNVAKAGAKDAWRMAWGMPTMRNMAVYDAHNNARKGNYGDAAFDIGSMGLFDAIGAKALPVVLGYGATRINDEDYQ